MENEQNNIKDLVNVIDNERLTSLRTYVYHRNFAFSRIELLYERICLVIYDNDIERMKKDVDTFEKEDTYPDTDNDIQFVDLLVKHHLFIIEHIINTFLCKKCDYEMYANVIRLNYAEERLYSPYKGNISKWVVKYTIVGDDALKTPEINSIMIKQLYECSHEELDKIKEWNTKVLDILKNAQKIIKDITDNGNIDIFRYQCY